MQPRILDISTNLKETDHAIKQDLLECNQTIFHH